MAQPKRVELVPVDKNRIEFTCKESDALLCPDIVDPLYKLSDDVKKNNGVLKAKSFFRTWTKQQSLVDLHAKDPVRYAYAAPAGSSFHQAGRAIDFDINGLNFQGIAKNDWLKKFWELAIPLGFKPIIKEPDTNISENWHFEYRGLWQGVSEKIGVKEAVKCAILDIGNWDPNEGIDKINNMFLQAQLLRLGYYEIKKADGIIGNVTKSMLKSVNISGLNVEQILMVLKQL